MAGIETIQYNFQTVNGLHVFPLFAGGIKSSVETSKAVTMKIRYDPWKSDYRYGIILSYTSDFPVSVLLEYLFFLPGSTVV